MPLKPIAQNAQHRLYHYEAAKEEVGMTSPCSSLDFPDQELPTKSTPVCQPQWGILIIEVALPNTGHLEFPPVPQQVKPGLKGCGLPVPCPWFLRTMASGGLRWTVYVPTLQRCPFLDPTLQEDTTLSLHLPPLTSAALEMSELPSSFPHPRDLWARGTSQHPSVWEVFFLLKDGVLDK